LLSPAVRPTLLLDHCDQQRRLEFHNFGPIDCEAFTDFGRKSAMKCNVLPVNVSEIAKA
jgi:hypothetical protein